MKTHVNPRGHCQCCGREINLKNDTIGRHGVLSERTLKYEGVCPGYGLPPLEIDRSKTDEIIGQIREKIQRDRQTVEDYRRGTKHPLRVARAERQWVNWEDATEQERKEGLEDALFLLRVTELMDQERIERLLALIERVHEPLAA